MCQALLEASPGSESFCHPDNRRRQTLRISLLHMAQLKHREVKGFYLFPTTKWKRHESNPGSPTRSQRPKGWGWGVCLCGPLLWVPAGLALEVGEAFG